jgi:hypothetical protein
MTRRDNSADGLPDSSRRTIKKQCDREPSPKGVILTAAVFQAEGRISRPLQRVQESSHARSLTRLNCAEFGMTPRIRGQAIKLPYEFLIFLRLVFFVDEQCSRAFLDFTSPLPG